MATTPAVHPFSLARRVALVTGGGQGLGLAMAEALADAGAHVIVCARSPARLDHAIDHLQARGASAEALALDITDEAAVAQAFANLDARHGRLDILASGPGSLLRTGIVARSSKPRLLACLVALVAGRVPVGRPDQSAAAWISNLAHGRDDVAASNLRPIAPSTSSTPRTGSRSAASDTLADARGLPTRSK